MIYDMRYIIFQLEAIVVPSGGQRFGRCPVTTFGPRRWGTGTDLKAWENHGKTTGKPWENHGKMVV